ncbi:hypothetical protein ACHAWF_018964 [Thalassiosira exigua]
MNQEYGDEVDGLVGGKRNGQSALEVEEDLSPLASAPYAPPPPPPRKSLLYYVATVQAFVIIYRYEVFLGAALAVSIAVAISSSYHHTHKKVNPFDAAHIRTDYTAVSSKYDLTLGSIDHWCLSGDDNSCRCEDPLEPMSKRSSQKWGAQHAENVKVAQAALLKIIAAEGDRAWNDYADYRYDELDDAWLDGPEDDWVYGEGARFETDDGGYDPWAEAWGKDTAPKEGEGEGGEDNQRERELEGEQTDGRERKLLDDEDDGYRLDVIFVGDSITEQRQGTQMGRPVDDYVGIKEVFGKTFTREKGGDFEGVAMGVAGDTTKNLLWRLINGEMPYGLTPRVWWVGIGINDLTMKGCSEEVVLLGILRVVEEIQNAHPDDTVVINSLLPVNRNADGLLEHLGKHHEDIALKKKEKNLLDSEMSKKRMHIDLWPSIVSLNEELAKFASKHKGVKFFNADSIFVDERQDGKYLKLDLMKDPVHPNLAGHKKWNNAIKKRLHEILKDE